MINFIFLLLLGIALVLLLFLLNSNREQKDLIRRELKSLKKLQKKNS